MKIPSKDFADVTLAIDISDGDGDGGHLQGGQSRRRLDFENLMFSNRDGSRPNEFFKEDGYFVDDVHLNVKGIVRLGKFLKFLAHNT